MVNPSDDSFGSGTTRIGGNKPDERYQVSLGDQSTFGGAPGHDDTVLESDMEIVDLASRYTIEGPLGKGGMGEVLLATDTRLKRKVAIKRVRSDKALSPVALSRFLTEAQSIASLNHFNIVQIYDYGRDKDGPFLIMEYVDGSSLLDRCRSGAIPLAEAIDITCQLCDGLGRAHELGIIHRDIKPANVLLTKDGKPKLTDFGLAKAEAADTGMTMAGAVLGTLDFMPPEQRREVTLTDARSDLWSLAATFYQMVTGRSPKIIRFSNLPDSLHSVLEKALEESKEDRYQSASEFRDALISSTNHIATFQIPDGDLGTGECPSCHTKNESHRKFCRECATSLRVNCLSCKVGVPVWDKICPECGKKQAELVAFRRAEMEAKRLEAEHECSQCDFYEATRIGKTIASETDSRLQHLKAWADTFLLKVSEEQVRQEKLSWKQYNDALKYRAAFDYPSAIRALEVIPDVIRSLEINQLLDRLNEEEKESSSVIELITKRLEKRELDGVQELVHRAIELRGYDEILVKLQKQLKDQQRLLNLQRDMIYLDAEQLFAQGKAQEARIALRKTPNVELKANQQLFKERLEFIVETELRLIAAFKQANADSILEPSKVVTLLQLMDAYLELNPKHEKIRGRYQQLIDRLSSSPLSYRDLCSKIPTRVLASLNRSPTVRESLLLVNSIDMVFKYIGPGKIKVNERKKPYSITVKNGLYMGCYQVTQAQYERVIGTNPSKYRGSQKPVDNVSWEEATEFCAKLTKLTDEKSVGLVYRLPTQAEWEYACRAGTTTLFGFGDDKSQITYYAWYKSNSGVCDVGNSGGGTHQVGQKRPNLWGLFDMHGNVKEWCQDCSDSPRNAERVCCGGSFYDESYWCQSASRSAYPLESRHNSVGFRIVAQVVQ